MFFFKIQSFFGFGSHAKQAKKIDRVLPDVSCIDDLCGNSLFHASKELCANAVESLFNSTGSQVELTVQDEEYSYNTTYCVPSSICSFC